MTFNKILLLFSLPFAGVLNVYAQVAPLQQVNRIISPDEERMSRFGSGVTANDFWTMIAQPSREAGGAVNIYPTEDLLEGAGQPVQIINSSQLPLLEDDFVNYFAMDLRVGIAWNPDQRDPNSPLREDVLVIKTEVELDDGSVEYWLNLFRYQEDENGNKSWEIDPGADYRSVENFHWDFHHGVLFLAFPGSANYELKLIESDVSGFQEIQIPELEDGVSGKFLFNENSLIGIHKIYEDLVEDQKAKARWNVVITGEWSIASKESILNVEVNSVRTQFSGLDSIGWLNKTEGSGGKVNFLSYEEITIPTDFESIYDATSLSLTQNWFGIGFAGRDTEMAENVGGVYLWERTTGIPLTLSWESFGWLSHSNPATGAGGLEEGDYFGQIVDFDPSGQSLIVTGENQLDVFRLRYENENLWNWVGRMEPDSVATGLNYGFALSALSDGAIVSESTLDFENQQEPVYVYRNVFPQHRLSDEFSALSVDKKTFYAESAVGSATSVSHEAGREAGEREHVNSLAGRTMWMLWQAPASSLVTFQTRSSSFDTILAIYPLKNDADILDLSFADLDVESRIESDDYDPTDDVVIEGEDTDTVSALLTSQVTFNAEESFYYAVVVSGPFAEGGWMELQWEMDGTSENFDFPVILEQPRRRTYEAGDEVTLSVTLSNSLNPDDFVFAWYFDDERVRDGDVVASGSTGFDTSELTIAALDSGLIGDYKVLVYNRNATSLALFSETARIEIGEEERSPGRLARRNVGAGGLSYEETTSNKLEGVLERIIIGDNALQGFDWRRQFGQSGTFPNVAVGAPGTQQFPAHDPDLSPSSLRDCENFDPYLKRYWALTCEDSGPIKFSIKDSVLNIKASIFLNRPPAIVDLFNLERIKCLTKEDPEFTYPALKDDLYFVMFEIINEPGSDLGTNAEFNWVIEEVVTCPPPKFVQNPKAEYEVCIGETVELKAEDEFQDSDKTYAWYKLENGIPVFIEGEGDSSLIIPDVSAEDLGCYVIKVFNCDFESVERVVCVNERSIEGPIQINVPSFSKLEVGGEAFFVWGIDNLPCEGLTDFEVQFPGGSELNSIPDFSVETGEMRWMIPENVIPGFYHVGISASVSDENADTANSLWMICKESDDLMIAITLDDQDDFNSVLVGIVQGLPGRQYKVAPYDPFGAVNSESDSNDSQEILMEYGELKSIRIDGSLSSFYFRGAN